MIDSGPELAQDRDPGPVIRRSLLLVPLLALTIFLSIRNSVAWIDSDIWYHLRAGQWILENLRVPLSDPFSTMEGTRWVAYSWLYEVLQHALYHFFQGSGFVIYTVTLSLLITFALFSFLRAITGHFALSVALAYAGMLAMAGQLQNRSYLFSILFFLVECHILHGALKSGDGKRLWILPPLFIVWANVHIQFVFGIFAYFLLVLDFLYGLFSHGQAGPRSKEKTALFLLGVGGACMLATLITPYHILIYGQLIKIWQQGEFYRFIDELRPIQFQGINDWAFLSIMGISGWACGWTRKIRPFFILFLGLAAFISFRSARDSWFGVIVGLSAMASLFAPPASKKTEPLSKFLVISAISGLVVWALIWFEVSKENIQRRVAEKFPVGAAADMEKRGGGGLIFSSFEWGSYFMWRLPQAKVSMDSRGYPYGGERFVRRLETLNAKKNWARDPDLLAANAVVLPPQWPLTSVLRLDPRYELVYADEVALVFCPSRKTAALRINHTDSPRSSGP